MNPKKIEQAFSKKTWVDLSIEVARRNVKEYDRIIKEKKKEYHDEM